MSDSAPVTNVKDLVARVTKSVANIDAHRSAMKVASAMAKSSTASSKAKEVNPK